jgi:hypothetical protein
MLPKKLARALGVSVDYLLGTFEDDEQGTVSPLVWLWLAPKPTPAVWYAQGRARWGYTTAVQKRKCVWMQIWF